VADARGDALAQVADVVVGQETGLLNAVAMEPMRKVVLLSHSTHENLTKHWVNTEALTGDVPCYPCHRSTSRSTSAPSTRRPAARPARRRSRRRGARRGAWARSTTLPSDRKRRARPRKRDPMAYTTTQLQALEDAIATGELTVEYDGKKSPTARSPS
jgi:hypothetical protein